MHSLQFWIKYPSINLRMSNAQARSSTHSDPRQNLQCIVFERKQDHVNHYLDQASWRKELKGKEQHHSFLLHELASYGLQALHELVSLVHDHVNDDPVTKIDGILEPGIFLAIVLAMVHNFLLTWEALILHLLSPMDAEVLTYEIDKQNKEEDCNRCHSKWERVICLPGDALTLKNRFFQNRISVVMILWFLRFEMSSLMRYSYKKNLSPQFRV
ncbi:hypothetical protein PVK06_038468 [Gossypium arboreum]|uniref:Uncharacterized protein n=1 Tax=Gossypium arboreum TaxID=29729 RepID=A0ABR0N0D2_GOSAR|nr:hypothetical protein PVK06_038468 [Gossypium arboreum]